MLQGWGLEGWGLGLAERNGENPSLGIQRGLSKRGKRPERRPLGQKGPFGAISALPAWLWGAEELLPISENCSATSVSACGMLQGWGLEGSGLGLADFQGVPALDVKMLPRDAPCPRHTYVLRTYVLEIPDPGRTVPAVPRAQKLERPCASQEGGSLLLRREGGFLRREGGFLRRGGGFLRRGV